MEAQCAGLGGKTSPACTAPPGRSLVWTAAAPTLTGGTPVPRGMGVPPMSEGTRAKTKGRRAGLSRPGFGIAPPASPPADLACLPMKPPEYSDSLFSLSGKVAVVIGGTGELCLRHGRGPRVRARRLSWSAATRRRRRRGSPKSMPRRRGVFRAGQRGEQGRAGGVAATVLARSGRVDIVVNGAGVNAATPFFEIGEEEFERIMRINVQGAFSAARCSAAISLGAGRAARSSTSAQCRAWCRSPGSSPYSASKAAVHNLSKNLARKWAPKNVRVNVLVPGFFPAEQNRKVLTPERVQSIMDHTPMKRFGGAHEPIAPPCCSPPGPAACYRP